MEAEFVQARKVLEARLMMRSVEDAAFRERLLKDPRAAIEEELGQPFPAALKVEAIEEPANTLLLVVPKASPASGELSDAQLEGVAGGLSMADVESALSSAWTSIKKAIGGGKFEVSTQTAVAGVRG